MKKTKLINDIDNDILNNDFVSVCRKQGVTIAEKLNKMMKAEIIAIDKIYNEVGCDFRWQVVIEFKDMPALKPGECEVNQK